MPVVEQDTTTKKDGNGVSVAFTFAFRIVNTSDIIVKVDKVVQTIVTDYTVVIATLPAEGGTVTFIVAPPAGTGNVLINLDLPYTQSSDFAIGGDVEANTLDDIHDKTTLLISQVRDITDRCIRVDADIFSTTFSAILPDPTLAANKGNPLRYKSDGTALETFTILSTDIASPITAEGEIIVGGSGGTPQKLVDGPNGSFIYRQSSVSGNLKYTVAADQDKVAHWDGNDFVYSYVADVGQNNTSSSPNNFGFTAVLSTNDIVITLTTADGSTPSATKPVWVPVRSSTATSGAITWEKMTATEVLTIPVGATLGHTAADITAGNTRRRMYVYLMRNGANDLELVVLTKAQIDTSQLQTTVAIGTGSDADNVLYSTSLRTSKPLILVGVIEATASTTPGTWTAVDIVSPWVPGMRKTGDVVQTVYTDEGATVASGMTVSVDDDTPPTITEGNEMFTQAFTPKSAINKLEITMCALLSHSSIVSPAFVVAIHQDAITNALRASRTRFDSTAADRGLVVSIYHEMIAGTTSSITFRLRAGSAVAGTMTLNEFMGIAAQSYTRIKEVYA